MAAQSKRPSELVVWSQTPPEWQQLTNGPHPPQPAICQPANAPSFHLPFFFLFFLCASIFSHACSHSGVVKHDLGAHQSPWLSCWQDALPPPTVMVPRNELSVTSRIHNPQNARTLSEAAGRLLDKNTFFTWQKTSVRRGFLVSLQAHLSCGLDTTCPECSPPRFWPWGWAFASVWGSEISKERSKIS